MKYVLKFRNFIETTLIDLKESLLDLTNPMKSVFNKLLYQNHDN